jgi:tripartite-type tricarboxylate transporter receptor subunit TctC
MSNGIFQGTRRSALLAGLLALLPLNFAQAAWPEKPIKIVLPFGAGGVADVTARILADRLGQKLNQRVVIENMPGPGGIAAAR